MPSIRKEVSVNPLEKHTEYSLSPKKFRSISRSKTGC